MATFGSLEEYFHPEITLTVKGRDYTPPLPSAELGLWFRTLTESALLHEHATAEEREQSFENLANLPGIPGWKPGMTLQQLVLGDVHAQMIADGVEHPYINYCAWTVVTWIIYGEEAARKFWQSGGRPEALSPANRAERRAIERTPGTPTAGANTTRTAASTSGTSRPRRRRGGRGGR